MRAALAFAFRRTAARLVLVAGAGGFVFVVYRALRPLHANQMAAGPACGSCVGHVVVGSSHWDLAIGSLGFLVAIVVAVGLHRRFSISR